jgi:hypothetical protein
MHAHLRRSLCLFVVQQSSDLDQTDKFNDKLRDSLHIRYLQQQNL